MSESQQRRGVARAGLALAGVATVALGGVGIGYCHDTSVAQQRDITLVNAADDAHNAWIDAQTALNHDQFLNDVAFQQSIYYWATEPSANGGLGLDSAMLYPGNLADPENSIFNGAFSRATEAMLVGQALQQVQWDHLLGVNQTLGDGGYETAIGQGLYDDLSGAGIVPDSDLAKDLAALIDPETVVSFSGFTGALTDLQNDLWSTAWSDLLGMFSIVPD